MISSHDISAVISGQQQALAASMQYAAQTSFSNMGGIGAYGSPFTTPPPMPQHHALAHQQTSFNYGGANLSGYGLGNRAGAMGVAGVHGAVSGASMGLGIAGAASMFGLGPGWLRAMGGTAGGIGGIGLMAGGHITGNMMQGAQEQAGIYSTLGQFNFSNPSSRNGRGFDRNNAKAIADFTREMAHMPELMTSMSELNRIMNGLGGMGVMNGLRDAKEFNRKFQESIHTLKDMAKIMQTSMEGAMQFFQEAKRSGIYDKAGMQQNAFQRQMVGGLTGMNQNQIGQLQFAGSQMSFGMGGSRRSGAMHALRTAGQIGVANEMGVFGENGIEELTGASGPEGIGIMSQMFSQASYAMSRSSLGTAMTLAAGAVDKSGRFTGKMDDDVIKRIRSGGISKNELLSMAHKKIDGNRGAKISFAAHRDHLTAEMASSVGVEGMAMELQDIIGERGFKGPDVMNLVMQRYRVDEKTANAVVQYMEKLPDIQRETGMKGQVEGRRLAESSMMNQNFSVDALKRKFHHKMDSTFSAPFRKWGADLSHTVSTYVEDFLDGFLERKSVEISEKTSQLVSSAMSGSSSAKKQVSKEISSLVTNSSRGQNRTYGTLHSLAATATDFQSADMLRYDTLSSESSKFAKRSKVAATGLGYDAYGKQGWLSKLAGRGVTEDYVLQNKSMGESWISNLKQIGEGKISVDPDALAKDDTGLSMGLGFMRNNIGDIIGHNSGELRGMSQEQRLNFIKKKLIDAGGSSVRVDKAIEQFAGKGIGFSALLDKLQKDTKTSGVYGSFNIGKMADEMAPSLKGSFGSVGQMAALIGKESESFASQFGDKSGVKALMGKESSARSLFLTAADASADGNAEAKKLLTMESLPTQEKEALMHKFGIKSEAELEHLSKMWMSSGGADKVHGGEKMKAALDAGSYAGIAKQIRDQGYSISSRLTGSGMKNSMAMGAISQFAEGLEGITSPEKLKDYLEGGGGVHNVLDTVGRLTGGDRKIAMGALGEGATAAFDAKSRFMRTGKLGALGADEDIKKYIAEHGHGKGLKGLSDKEKTAVGDMVRDRTYAGSLAYKGQAGQKDFQGELMTKLNEFARTSSNFAQLIIDATPTLSANVVAAAARHQQSSEDIQGGQSREPTGGQSR